MTNFQKIISEIVAKDPLRQVGVAEKLGVTDAYVSNFVTGSRKLSKNIAKRIEEVYGLNGNELLSIQKYEEAESIKIVKPDKKADALQQLDKVQNGKQKNAGEGRRVNEGDVIKIKTFIIPIKGFSGLKNALYDDQYITENFEQETTEVPKEYYASTSYKIQSTGNSMPKTIPEGAWVTGVPIPEQDWLNYKFRSDKVYIFFHPYKGILFKNAKNLPHDEVRLCSENIDKEDYPDEDFKITEFRKICVAIKVETFI